MIFKTDKLDYLGSPKTKLFSESFFFIGQGTSSTVKWNWNLLGFSSFIIILAQCVMSQLLKNIHYRSIHIKQRTEVGEDCAH